MHKSIIVFLGLLVILLPLGNSLNNQNANAIANVDNSDRKQVSVNSLNCNNINVNVNGLELDVFPSFLGGDSSLAAEAVEGNTDASSIAGNDASQINDFRFICINNNNNTVVEGEGPNPPTPPEPPTASLTVKKQVFGCDTIVPHDIPIEYIAMECQNLENGSSDWFNCNDNPAISSTSFCQSLPESIFDIEVLDDQNTQIQQFKGSEQGTTIQNLEPGTYTVNEIPVDPDDEQQCVNAGFTDGQELFNSTSIISYVPICIEYVDEQGNDCSTITLAAGEERTCIVKNYIRLAQDVLPVV